MSVIELRTPAEIEEMRPAGRFVASVLEATAQAAAVGVNLLELDALAHEMIRKAGAESCYAVALPDGRAFALKTDDGAARVRPVLMAEALRRSGVLEEVGVDADSVRRTGVVELLGGGHPVGEIRASF